MRYDVSPLAPCGIDRQTIELDTFALLPAERGPKTNNNEYRQITENQRRTVADGRNPELELLDGDNSRKLVDWGMALVAEMTTVAELLDRANQTNEHRAAPIPCPAPGG